MRILLLLVFIGFSSANEHWFVFDQYQFLGFQTPLFTLISTSNNQVNQQEEKYLSFGLSTYDRTIQIDIHSRDANGTIQQQESLIKLSIERADLLLNTINHMIFIAIRDQTKIETYVNCKLIDSYLLYSSILTNDYDNENLSYKIKSINENIEHYEITSSNDNTQQEIFETFSCKQTNVSMYVESKTTANIERPLVRKMQHVIEKVQRRKQRPRRQNSQLTSPTTSSDSITIIYKPNLDIINKNHKNSHTILNIAELNFQIQYYLNDHLFNIRFNNENHTEYLLYADKSFDRILSLNNSLVIFLHITPTIITCYMNCELIDQEFILDQFYIENRIKQIMNHQHSEYNRQSTLILFNKSIDQIGTDFFCLKLDKKNQELLPDKFTLRKFSTALDILVNNLDSPINHNQNERSFPRTSTSTSTTTATTETQSISAINIPLINGFGSLKQPSVNSISHELTEYDRTCSIDEHCDTNKSLLTCQSNHCTCPKRLFWSSTLHRCIICHDLLIGNRCFRLSNHKSTWNEANDYCQNDDDDNDDDNQPEYTMKLVSSLNQTDIQYFKKIFLNHHDAEHVDYMYWIGATTDLNSKKLYNYRTKREISTTTFHWYDTHEIAKINHNDIWCSQMDYAHLATINNNELCVSITSCGLYTDDCQRNYRFICEAI